MHTLNFIEVDLSGTLIQGFKFAKDFDDQLFDEGQFGATRPTNLNYTQAGYVVTRPDAPDSPTEGEGLFTISKRKGDPVTLGVLDPGGDDTDDDSMPPSMMFEVTEAGNAVVTVSYHVWDTDLDGDEDVDNPDPGWRTASETVNIEISAVPEYMGSDGMFP